ncbi:type II secretion system major pseudopilin GspG [Burkholderiaceae bacterium DAT-1]|nr:type II secretion system major pseudopilin GspG [Burkholderiaceae bacterium DAT-1]
MKRTHQGGFTLLELLVVLLIIGLLAGYVGPKYFSQIGRSNRTVAAAQIEAFSKAIDQFRVDTGQFPTTAQGLNALVAQPTDVTRWAGPYLKKGIPLDPWGHAYVYTAPGGGTPARDYDIVSLGRDGAAGGSDDDADILSY